MVPRSSTSRTDHNRPATCFGLTQVQSRSSFNMREKISAIRNFMFQGRRDSGDMMWNLKSAGTAIAVAREFGAQNGLKSLAVVALDAGGYVQATEREDDASNGRVDIASGKATGALEFGMALVRS